MYNPFTPYAYVANDPINYYDPDGMQIEESSTGWTFTGDDISWLHSYLNSSVNTGGNFQNIVRHLNSFDFSGGAGGGGSSSFWDGIYGVNAVLPEVVINVRAGQGFGEGTYNSLMMERAFENSAMQWNISQARGSLYDAIANTQVGQSVTGFENFLFKDIPQFFVGGSLFNAGWKAIGAGKYLSGIVNNLYARVAPKILANFTEAGTYSVYHGIENGVVKYVGITSRDAAVRFSEHRAAGGAKALLDFEVVQGATGLTKTQARVLEQKLINQYGLPNLFNKINSISPKKWGMYGITP